MYIRLDIIPQRDGQKDGRADRQQCLIKIAPPLTRDKLVIGPTCTPA